MHSLAGRLQSERLQSQATRFVAGNAFFRWQAAVWEAPGLKPPDSELALHSLALERCIGPLTVAVSWEI